MKEENGTLAQLRPRKWVDLEAQSNNLKRHNVENIVFNKVLVS